MAREATDRRSSVFRWPGATGLRLLLIVFILTILVPDADGPSPWDATAFRKGMIEMIANFRILDELADLSIVKVADVGAGLLIVDLEQIGVSNRKFGWAPFYIALACAALCLFLRAVRLRLLAQALRNPLVGQGPAFGVLLRPRPEPVLSVRSG